MAQGQAEAVHGHHRYAPHLHLKQGPRVNGPVFVGGDGEGGLVDHRLQGALLQGEGVFALHLGHLRVIVGGQPQNFKPCLAAGEGDHVLLVGGEHDDIIGHFADDVPEKPGVQHNAPLLADVGLQAGADAGLHIVSGQGQHLRALQQQALQAGDRAFGGHGAGRGIHGELQQRLFAGKFQHGTDSFLIPKFPGIFSAHRT